MALDGLGGSLRAALRPGEVRPADGGYSGPRWPGIAGAFGGACLVLATITMLVVSQAWLMEYRDTFITLAFSAFVVAGALLSLAWGAAFQNGFGNVPVLLGCIAVMGCFGFLLVQELPEMPDPWVRDVVEAREAAWAALQRATKLRGFLVVAPFVPFFAGLIGVRKLKWLRVIAAIGLGVSLAMCAIMIENIEISSTVRRAVDYSFVGSLMLAGIGLIAAFIGLAQSARATNRGAA